MESKKDVEIILPIDNIHAVFDGLEREIEKDEKNAKIEGRLWIIFVILLVIFVGVMVVC